MGTRVRQPTQPIIIDEHGTERFQENAIVRWLVDSHPQALNHIAMMKFPIGDRVQLAQLIGYSLCGFSELPYVTDKAWARATYKAKSTDAEPATKEIDSTPELL